MVSQVVCCFWNQTSSGSTHSVYCGANQENKWTCRDFKAESVGAVEGDFCFESAQSYLGQQANNLTGKVWILCSSDAMIALSVLVNADNIFSAGEIIQECLQDFLDFTFL